MTLPHDDARPNAARLEAARLHTARLTTARLTTARLSTAQVDRAAGVLLGMACGDAWAPRTSSDRHLARVGTPTPLQRLRLG